MRMLIIVLCECWSAARKYPGAGSLGESCYQYKGPLTNSRLNAYILTVCFYLTQCLTQTPATPLGPWLEFRDAHEHEWTRLSKYFRIWGQPSAWANETICVWQSDFVKERWVQAITLCDCLGSQWTPTVLLTAWLNNQMQMAISPEAGGEVYKPRGFINPIFHILVFPHRTISKNV